MNIFNLINIYLFAFFQMLFLNLLLEHGFAQFFFPAAQFLFIKKKQIIIRPVLKVFKAEENLLFEPDVIKHGLDFHFPVFLHCVEALVGRLSER